MRDQYKGIPVSKFIGLKSKRNSILSDDGKEPSTAKGVNIATEYKEYKGALLNNKIMRQNEKNSN